MKTVHEMAEEFAVNIEAHNTLAGLFMIRRADILRFQYLFNASSN